MKFRGTLMLATLAILFGAYIYFIEIKKAAKDDEVKAESEKIIPFEAEKIKKIELKSAQGTFSLEKNTSGSWVIKAPLEDSADDQTITGMLSGVSSEKYDQVVAEGDVDLKIYGLDQPKIDLKLTLQDGSIKEIKIGNEGAISGKIYVQRNDEKKILFANLALKTQVDKSLKDFRDKRLFRKNKSDVTEISLSIHRPDNQSNIELVKKENDWMLEKPISEKADGESVQNFLSSIENLRATDFASEKGSEKVERAKFKLDKPEMTLLFADKDKKELVKIVLGAKKDNNTYALLADNPTIFQMYSSSIDPLFKTPESFRDKKTPFEFKKDDLGQITLKTSFTDVNLVKKGTNWEQKLPDPSKEVSQIQVSSLIDKLAQFKIEEFLSHESPKGLNPPQGTVTLKDAKGGEILTLKWGDKTKTGKSYFIESSKTKSVYGIEASLIDTLPGQTLVETKSPSPSQGGALPPPSINQAAADKQAPGNRKFSLPPAPRPQPAK